MWQKYKVALSDHIVPWLCLAYIALMPSQLGIHFFPQFSYVDGVRVDYLALRLYLTDILCALIVASHFISRYGIATQRPRVSKHLKITLAFVIANIYLSLAPAVTTQYFIRLGLLIMAGYICTRTLSASQVVAALSVSVAYELVLCLMQLTKQSSIGGAWYYLGERDMHRYTQSAALASLDGVQILRPYGTFSHPNTMAGYALIVSAYISLRMARSRENVTSLISIMSAFIYFASGALVFLSFSKYTILCFVIIQTVLVMQYRKLQVCRLCVFVRPLVFVTIAILFWRFGGDPESLAKRSYLAAVGLDAFADHSIFGVGFGAFTRYFDQYSNYFRGQVLTQPPHNVFVLALAEGGLSFAILAIYYMRKYLASIVRYTSSHYVFIFALVFIALFDHYLATQVQALSIMFLTTLLLTSHKN